MRMAGGPGRRQTVGLPATRRGRRDHARSRVRGDKAADAVLDGPGHGPWYTPPDHRLEQRPGHVLATGGRLVRRAQGEWRRGDGGYRRRSRATADLDRGSHDRRRPPARRTRPGYRRRTYRVRESV